MKFTDKQLLDRTKALPNFTNLPSNLIVCVRNSDDIPNEFDDKLYVYINGQFKLAATCTTNPGTPALVNGWKRFNKNGAAIIKSDEIFYNAYMKSDGKQVPHHNGKMQCLRLIKKILAFRDKDNDVKAEEMGELYEGNFSTNIHFSNYDLFSKIVKRFIGGWSYGCVVLNDAKDYRSLLELMPYGEPISLVILKSDKIR